MFPSNCREILITGGTGTFGRALLKKIVFSKNSFERIVIFSRDELKQWELKQLYPKDKFPNLRFLLGDIRDKDRLYRALEGIDIVVHAAALKQVPSAEYDPFEFIKTNIIGSQNLIEACFDKGVKHLVALSTDKAAAPINLYGATKLCSDKLFIAANNIIGKRDLRFSVVRYGNVMGSRGSVIPFFLKEAKNKVLRVTNSKMTRFNIILDEAVDMVIWALNNAIGGEIFVPKIPSYRIMDVVNAIGPNCEVEIIGIRPGEKLHEEMITISDGNSTIDLGKYYAILPSDGDLMKKYESAGINYKKVVNGFSYNSGQNKDFLNVSELRTLIKSNISADFEPS
tara:strand:+ start:32 stop:1051 length:1020 start_codon:yes stop_codon:yes gene_type:complete